MRRSVVLAVLRGSFGVGLVLVSGAVASPAAFATYAGRNGPLLAVRTVCDESGCRSDLRMFDQRGKPGVVSARLRRLASLYPRPSVAFSRDGRYVAIAARDRVYWGPATGRGVWQSRHSFRYSFGGYSLGGPAWTPGGRLAYNCIPRGICTMERDGTPRRLLTRGFEPDWSARGDLALVRDTPFLRSRLVVIARSGRTRTLTTPDDESCGDPSWAPDGRELAAACFLGSGAPTDPHRNVVVVMRPDGGGRREVAEGWGPAFAPDGRHIVFVTQRGIAVVPREGGTSRLLMRSLVASDVIWIPTAR